MTAADPQSKALVFYGRGSENVLYLTSLSVTSWWGKVLRRRNL